MATGHAWENRVTGLSAELVQDSDGFEKLLDYGQTFNNPTRQRWPKVFCPRYTGRGSVPRFAPSQRSLSQRSISSILTRSLPRWRRAPERPSDSSRWDFDEVGLSKRARAI